MLVLMVGALVALIVSIESRDNRVRAQTVQFSPQYGAIANAAATGITIDTTIEAAATDLRLLGITIRESNNAAATVIVRNDTVATTCDGPVLAIFQLLANTSQTVWFGDRGIGAAAGICADVTAGQADMAIYEAVEMVP